jgi:hypothetical protein
MDCVEGETGSCSETCVMCAADGTEEFGVKVEEVIDTSCEIPQPKTFSEIKTLGKALEFFVRWWQLMLHRSFIATKKKF